MYLACGESDFLYDVNQEMVDSMKQNGVGVTFFEHGPGDHNWIFWDQWIQRALDWLLKKIKLIETADFRLPKAYFWHRLWSVVFYLIIEFER